MTTRLSHVSACTTVAANAHVYDTSPTPTTMAGEFIYTVPVRASWSAATVGAPAVYVASVYCLHAFACTALHGGSERRAVIRLHR